LPTSSSAVVSRGAACRMVNTMEWGDVLQRSCVGSGQVAGRRRGRRGHGVVGESGQLEIGVDLAQHTTT
jgi:hypothetical protein